MTTSANEFAGVQRKPVRRHIESVLHQPRIMRVCAEQHFVFGDIERQHSDVCQFVRSGRQRVCERRSVAAHWIPNELLCVRGRSRPVEGLRRWTAGQLARILTFRWVVFHRFYVQYSGLPRDLHVPKYRTHQW